MFITIEVIPHMFQRYPTAGDWIIKESPDDPKRSTLHIRVSNTGEPRANLVLAIHELVEALLCINDGIKPDQVDAWDMGPGLSLDEPGEHPDAPYHSQHMDAEIIERMVARMLGLPWDKYTNLIEALFPEEEKNE